MAEGEDQGMSLVDQAFVKYTGKHLSDQALDRKFSFVIIHGFVSYDNTGNLSGIVITSTAC
jgi:hypothetical protein